MLDQPRSRSLRSAWDIPNINTFLLLLLLILHAERLANQQRAHLHIEALKVQRRALSECEIAVRDDTIKCKTYQMFNIHGGKAPRIIVAP